MSLTVVEEKTATGSNPSVTFSATPADGELLVFAIAGRTSFTPPSGCTLEIAEETRSDCRVYIYTKIAASESGATYSFSGANSNNGLTAARITGGEVYLSAKNNSGSGATVSAASATFDVPDNSYVLAAWQRFGGNLGGATVDNSFVKKVDYSQSRSVSATRKYTTGGGAENVSSTVSGSTTCGAAVIVVWEPPPPAEADADGAAIEASAGVAIATGGALAAAVADAIEASAGAASATGGALAAAEAAAIEFVAGEASADALTLAAAVGETIEAAAGAVGVDIATSAVAAGETIEFAAGAATGAGGAFASAVGAEIEFDAGATGVDIVLPPLPIPPRQPLPIVLVEIDKDGLRYFSDGRYVDAAAGIVAEARLGRSITFERRVSTIFWGGGSSRAALGAIELANADGGLDDLVYADLRDGAIRIFIGDDQTPFSALTQVAVAVIDRVETVGEQSLRVVTASRDALFSRAAATSTYSSGDQIGRVRPKVYGGVLNVPALATDISNLIFSVHDSSSFVMQGVRDRGAVLTPTTQWDTYSTSPHFGFELLQATSGRITADVEGPRPDTGYDRYQLPNVVRQVLIDAGWSDYDSDMLPDLQTALGEDMRLGYFVDGAVTFKQILDEIADSIAGWWYVDHLGDFQLSPLTLPSGTPEIEITETELASEVTVRFDDAPGLSTTIAGLRNWHVHSTDELAGSVRDTAAGIALTKDYQTRLSFNVAVCYGGAAVLTGGQRDYSRSSVERADPAPGSGGARRLRSDQGHGTLIVDVDGLDDERDRRAALWAAPRYFYTCAVQLLRTTAATLEPGSVASLSVPVAGGYRYALDGHLTRVIGVRGEIGAAEVELTLWGPGPA